jgi:hypothetical protein
MCEDVSAWLVRLCSLFCPDFLLAIGHRHALATHKQATKALNKILKVSIYFCIHSSQLPSE